MNYLDTNSTIVVANSLKDITVNTLNAKSQVITGKSGVAPVLTVTGTTGDDTSNLVLLQNTGNTAILKVKPSVNTKNAIISLESKKDWRLTSDSAGNLLTYQNTDGFAPIYTNGTTGITTIVGKTGNDSALDINTLNYYGVRLSGSQAVVDGGSNQYSIFNNQTMVPTNGSSLSIGYYGLHTMSAPATKTISNAECLRITNIYNSNAGTITNGHGIVVTPAIGGAGTLTNLYGAYISNPGVGTNRTALYAEDLSVGYAPVSPPTNGAVISGSVGIGASSVGATCALQVTSTTKGVRFPNMTTAEKNAIANTAGLVVFDTTLAKLCVNSGAGWETITSV